MGSRLLGSSFTRFGGVQVVGFRVLDIRTLPLARKTDLFKKLYIETIIRNPTKVGFFRPQVKARFEGLGFRFQWVWDEKQSSHARKLRVAEPLSERSWKASAVREKLFARTKSTVQGISVIWASSGCGAWPFKTFWVRNLRGSWVSIPDGPKQAELEPPPPPNVGTWLKQPGPSTPNQRIHIQNWTLIRTQICFNQVPFLPSTQNSKAYVIPTTLTQRVQRC